MAAYTQKHYREAAATIREVVEGAYTEVELSAAVVIVRNLADMYKRDNPKFRYDTFYEACGLDEWGQVK